MRLILADDHTLFREGLRYILKDLDQDIDILEAESYQDVVQAIERNPDVDVVLLDLSMPGMDRHASVRALTQRFSDRRIVVLSASEDRADVREALASGAKGFIPKSSNREVMVSALRLVLSGGTYLPPFLLEGEDPPPAPGDGAVLSALTPRQRDVLNCLAEGKSNKEIARELGLAEGTVKIHIAGILKSLKVSNRTQAIIAAGRLKDKAG